MSNAIISWEPATNPIHRIIQILDVLAIPLCRFAYTGARMPAVTKDSEVMWREKTITLSSSLILVQCEISERSFRWLLSHDIIDRLHDEAVAAFAIAGVDRPKSLRVVGRVTRWFDSTRVWCNNELPTWGDWHTCTSHPYLAVRNREWGKLVDTARDYYEQYHSLRRELLRALASIGMLVPTEIGARNYFDLVISADLDETYPIERLYEMVAEAFPDPPETSREYRSWQFGVRQGFVSYDEFAKRFPPEGNAHTGTVEASSAPAFPGSTELLSATDIATRYNLSRDAIRKALERHALNFPDCYVENDSPRAGEAKYLYRVGDVFHLIARAKKAT